MIREPTEVAVADDFADQVDASGLRGIHAGDDGLLKIDPSTLTGVLDPSLRETPYWPLNGATLRPPLDASQPSREHLRARWQTPPAAGT
ncbi:MAG: hypothetical protein KY467_04740 [Gemmatimonadetes bacterium]|nr:hypothetical protein [Gemmatimonadota bacterium]